MAIQSRTSSILAFFAVLLAFLVVVLGAYTRATDAGLGCPDWPGCYNRMIAPDNSQQIQQAEKQFPNATVQVKKAWTEMIHRYAAGTLLLLIVILTIQAILRRHVVGQPLFVPVLLLVLGVFQALLGMWTVTLKLYPPVVMGHLLGGMTILALLWWLFLKLRTQTFNAVSVAKLKPWAIIGLIIVALQIALGGWTSSNYAALICPNFPYCNMQMFYPQYNFHEAFTIFSTVGKHLSQAALITIQMTHRVGGLITALYIGIFSFYLMLAGRLPELKKLGFFMFVILLIQISLGIINVVWLLPLASAVAHNAFAALLLLSVVTLNYVVFRPTAKVR